MDLNQQPTVAPTGDPALVGSQATLAGNLVNPAQAPSSMQQAFPTQQQGQGQYVPPTSSQQQQQVVPTSDVSGLINTYEKRIRDLMSEKDKAINERNASISAQAEMQRQLTTLQESATTGLSQAVDNAQKAINENNALRQRVQALEAELTRFKVLSETPDLLPYATYIPASADETQVRQHVETFKGMREADLARFRPAGYAPVPAIPGVPPIPQFTPMGSPVPGGQPLAQPAPVGAAPQGQQGQLAATPQQPQPNPMNLYTQRPTMAPQYQQVPGSQPAMMSPAGAQSTPDSINAMLQAAREQGPDAFNAALEQAKTLAASYTQQQLYR
jgi:hypothetical protein